MMWYLTSIVLGLALFASPAMAQSPSDTVYVMNPKDGKSYITTLNKLTDGYKFDEKGAEDDRLMGVRVDADRAREWWNAQDLFGLKKPQCADKFFTVFARKQEGSVIAELRGTHGKCKGVVTMGAVVACKDQPNLYQVVWVGKQPLDKCPDAAAKQ